ncbi:hypothetical protein COW36_03010 [bacterium (Candidatus Blackallbacteria) CG17_big_fil_post_rev_8_21_14_2_50_48_46]|uniref:Class I SAM-dependent methyltransferase n=1 Tax=bacterium (Candidatus Blackallbacteria) CG17_big_fil_post_rev_8_21_14_2_50_48_46 TaxID=2014261 RepID=A0A2M7GAZ4_9BACT|nr:MAG: hypothetical protein COW64_12465 [bacterium (Candidatus Blackallbacteria) CG18_big_fil_WC_8_21_14_2_50_49_26]PIW19097.1 MAG: hypothetical protein COW36_03010 [bacterium (Candidatus Blackallbacteria) CG17_big_fil_post_rev_8_21_14_2_50_48_46]PIW44536.1 MAG: hypothetical protein COW20_23110 [bacterium (Candidatus Blackallbacteria) CG13_big_fil_rev_8_21_14_2_50_49_14]
MNPFNEAVKRVQCWDIAAQHLYEQRGAPPDCLLQNPLELADFCQWIAEHRIRSFLEIGIWTGRLTCFLQDLFQFEMIAVCDARMAETEAGLKIQVPPQTQCFWGSSHSIEYMAWRNELGPVDLVLIDAEHSYEGVKQDFLINARYPQKYLAFHDIAGDNPWTAGSKRLWQELPGKKTEIIHPRAYAHQGIPMMGIGIWAGV